MGEGTPDFQMAAWKKQFFTALQPPPFVTTIFLRIETRHVKKKVVQYQLIPAVGWKAYLPPFISESSEQVVALRRELSATLKLNGMNVVHRNSEWMNYLKNHSEVGMSYAELCSAI